MRHTRSPLALLVAAAVLVACSDATRAATEPGRPNSGAMDLVTQPDQPTLQDPDSVHVVRASGDIAGAVGEYRGLLGTLNPIVAEEQSAGRREVNWDVVPPTLTNNDLFPGDFFNTISPRGLLLTTEGSAFRISDIGYIDVNPSYTGEFRIFSPRRLFTARGSTVIDVRFAVAGSNTPATVTGFGSVFSDVGLPFSTTMQYFDAAGNQLLAIVVPRRSDARGLSFAGATFPSAIVARVRITAGDTPIDASAFDNVTGPGERHDIVVMDDFIYGEPHPIN